MKSNGPCPVGPERYKKHQISHGLLQLLILRYSGVGQSRGILHSTLYLTALVVLYLTDFYYEHVYSMSPLHLGYGFPTVSSCQEY